MLSSPESTLLASATGYPLLLRLLCGRSLSPQKLSASIRTISTIHSTFTTLLALYILKDLPLPSPPFTASIRNHGSLPDDSQNPLITHRAPLANTATALETGYLLSSLPSLLYEARLHRRKASKTMLAHHAGIGSALLVLQAYIWRRKERGVGIIVMLLLMNASTPLLNLRWYIKTHHTENQMLRKAVDVLFALAFLMARVCLVPAVVGWYGRAHGLGPLETWWRGLRWHCALGSGAIWAGNLAWWVAMLREMGGAKRQKAIG